MDKSIPPLSQFQKALEARFIQINRLSISMDMQEVLCRRCQKILSSIDYNSHKKNCKRESSRSSSLRETISLVNNQIEGIKEVETNMNNENSKNVSKKQKGEENNEFLNNLLTGVLGFIKIGIVQLLSRTKYLKPEVVIKVLGQKCVKFASQIPSIIDPNDYGQLISDKFMAVAIKNINDVFDPATVLQRIKIYKTSRKSKIKKKLNAYLEKIGLKPLYTIEKIRYLTETDKKPLMFRQLSGFVLKLFATKQKMFIHLALDFLIIFHSLQRFPSSYQLMQEKVLEIIRGYPSSKKLCAKIQEVTKTSMTQYVYLNSQLIKWLIQFKWKNFCFQRKFYERFSRYFNFTLLSLRRGVISQTAISLKIVQDPTKLTGHKSLKNAIKYYCKLEDLGKAKFHESLEIKQDSMLRPKYINYQCLDRIFPKIISQIEIQEEFYELAQFKNSTKIPISFQNQEQRHSQSQQKIFEQLSDSLSQSEEDEVAELKEIIHIEGIEYELKNGHFSSEIYFQNKSKQKCYECQKMNPDRICLFCLKQYHLNCCPKLCHCMQINTKSIGIVNTFNTKRTKTLLMPGKYFNQTQSYFHSVCKLIFMRGFRVTLVGNLFQGETCQTLTQNIKKARYQQHLSICEQNCTKLDLTRYEQYQMGKYFPPLIIGESGDSNLYGTGVGLFCDDDIEQNTFIGEYAGDIMSQDDMIFAKRKDMSMLLAKISGKSYFVASTMHSSYVQLVNCSQENANCAIVLGEVNKKLKLLLYTTQKIKKGSQLLYFYGNNFKLKYKNKLKQSLNIKSQKNPSVFHNFTFDSPQNNLNLTSANISQNIQITNQSVKDVTFQINANQATTTNIIFENSNLNSGLKSFEVQTEKRQKIAIYDQETVKNSQPKKRLKRGEVIDNRNKNLKSSEIQLCERIKFERNNCYSHAILFLFRHLRHQIQNRDQFTNQIMRNTCNSSYFTDIFSHTKFLQHDIGQFFQFINNNLFRNSPFPTLIYRIDVFCLNKACGLTFRKFDVVKFINSGFKLQIEKSICNVQDYKCPQCNQISATTTSESQIVSDPKRFFVYVKRFTNKLQKITAQLSYKQIVFIRGHEYHLKYLVFHSGHSISSGHYYLYLCKEKLFINSSQTRILKNEITCLIYQIHLFNFHEVKFLEHQSSTLSEVNENNEKYIFSEIASIGKLITMVEIIKILKEKKIVFSKKIPTKSLGLTKTTHLNLGKSEQILHLIQYSLVISCCNSMFSIVQFAKTLINTEIEDDHPIQNIVNNKLRSMGLKNTFISDAIGLQPNVSTKEDLFLVIDSFDQYIWDILSKFSVVHQTQIIDNTNKAIKQYIGKTGLSRNYRKCFIGRNKKTKSKVILLNFSENKIWDAIQSL